MESVVVAKEGEDQVESEHVRSDLTKSDLILERIFWFCDIPSLKNIRLVSKKWRDLSLEAWRNKAVIQLSFNANPELEFGKFLKSTHSVTVNDKVPLIRLWKHPFKQYSVEFKEYCPGDEACKKQKGISEVIANRRAHHVKIRWDCCVTFNKFDEYLSILNVNYSLKTLEVTWVTLQEAIPTAIQPSMCPNLRRLKLFTAILYRRHSPDLSLWRFLLKSCPNLEALSVGYGLTLVDTEANENYSICLADRLAIGNLLKNLKQSGGETMIPLKELEMMDVPTSRFQFGTKEYDIIKALAACKFPLERLNIRIDWGGSSLGGDKQILIRLLLKSCHDTLQYLKASINFHFGTSSMFGLKNAVSHMKPTKKSEKVCMEVLKEVRLLNGLEWATFFLAHLKLPVLEKLIVEREVNQYSCQNDRSDHGSVWLPKRTVYDRLETFELHDNAIMPTPEMIGTFFQMMPDLVHLTIPLDKRTFPAICLFFTGLKTLHILSGLNDYDELDDEVLTGISKEEMQEGRVPSERPRLNITGLEHLTDLRICCRRQLERNELKFTEHSVMYGFLQLPRLYYLSVAIKEMSEQMKDKLLGHVKGNVHFQTKNIIPGDGE